MMAVHIWNSGCWHGTQRGSSMNHGALLISQMPSSTICTDLKVKHYVILHNLKCVSSCMTFEINIRNFSILISLSLFSE